MFKPTITFMQLQKLSLTDQLPYYTARVRRTFTRGESPILQKIRQRILSKENYKVQARHLIITPELVGCKVKVYSGKEYVEVTVLPQMCGRYLGDFVRTRKPVKHGKAGIGASRGTKFVPIK